MIRAWKRDLIRSIFVVTIIFLIFKPASHPSKGTRVRNNMRSLAPPMLHTLLPSRNIPQLPGSIVHHYHISDRFHRKKNGRSFCRIQATTGMLSKIPMVADPEDILRGAINRARKQTPAPRIQNAAEREKSRAAKQIQTLHLGLIGPLKKYMEGFPRLSRVHDFEQAMVVLTLGDTRYDRALDEVASLRKRVNEICKSYANRIKNVRKKQDVIDVMDEAFTTIERVFSRDMEAITKLKYNAIQLRKLPQVDLTEGTIALVGAPNVGKSSLVRHLSSGEPEVNAYPFTTRDIKMGHFFAEGCRHQLTDTPGLLLRDPALRNNMENLTMATLSFLPTSVLFVMDLTGQCGTNVSQQLGIRRELLDEFPHKEWIDVFTKADLVFTEEGQLNNETADLEAHVAVNKMPNALRVSSATEEGLLVLKSGMIAAMVSHRRKKQAQSLH